jgi:hypothetical protein
MNQLLTYTDLSEKRKIFQEESYFVIDSKSDFDDWYNSVVKRQSDAKKKLGESSLESEYEDNVYNHYPFIFRGVGEAKFKIYTSAQRDWIVNDMMEWAGKPYLEFIDDLIKKAHNKPLLSKVFNYYSLYPNQRDFPTLSILQHYGAPTPLIDFTYNLDVALYFAIENCEPSLSSNIIDRYFSINIIDRTLQKNEFLNLMQFNQGAFPRLSSFYEWETSPNALFYITDFENRFSRKSKKGFQDLRPLTILFNQRIIPQEGLFVFNPSSTMPLEDRFNLAEEGSNLHLKKMTCVNIKKSLSDYVRRKIKKPGSDVDKLFIYPQLDDYVKHVKNEILDSLV